MEWLYMFKKKIWMQMRSSFWFEPAIYGLNALLAVWLCTLADGMVIKHFKTAIPRILLTNPDVAKELYSALATATLTMTTISFSTIMVVLTTYSTQFSPRTLQDFMRSKITHQILGMYTFVFVFALMNLLLVGNTNQIVRPTAMVITAIMGLAFFIYFIHYTSRHIQVNQLIHMIHKDGTRIVKETYSEKTYVETGTWPQAEIESIYKRKCAVLYAKQSGYLQDVDWKGLFVYADKAGIILDVQIQAGSFLVEGEVLTNVYSREEISPERLKALHEYFAVGAERSDLQDIAFSIEKLAEIAMRAISPAVNDPHTAINCINRIGAMLVTIGREIKNMHYLANDAGELRIIRPMMPFEDYLYKGFYQLKHYGKKDVSVLYSLFTILGKVASVSGDTVKQKIWAFHFEILAVFDWETLTKQDFAHLYSAYQRLVSICRHNA